MEGVQMTATSFTPVASLAGGALIGFAAVLLMWATGRIAGVSGIAARLFPPYEDRELAGRVAFVAGLIAAPLLVRLATGSWPAQVIEAGTAVLVVAGLLVGFGSVWGSGCTSGHGVCGLSRLSARSLVATATFMATGIATVFVLRHWS
nr:YeeE/YedE family protein [Bradyrhizobium manausense]